MRIFRPDLPLFDTRKSTCDALHPERVIFPSVALLILRCCRVKFEVPNLKSLYIFFLSLCARNYLSLNMIANSLDRSMHY